MPYALQGDEFTRQRRQGSFRREQAGIDANLRRSINAGDQASADTIQGGRRAFRAGEAQFSRDQVGMDDTQRNSSYMGLLDALKTKGLMGGGGSSSSSSSGGMSPSGTWTPSSPTAARFAPIQAVDTSGAQAAAFARAKDQVGQTSAGALAGLRSAMGGRGMLGSGAESRGTANVINQGMGELGDVSREQAIDSADQAQRTAEFNYSGGVQQRGQDIASADTRRGQDISLHESNASRTEQSNQERLRAILGLYQSFGSRPGAGTVY